MLREPLGLFFAEYLAVFGVFRRDFCFVCFLCGSYCCLAQQDLIGVNDSWFIDGSWQESSLCCICGFKYDGQLCMVDPSSSPIDLWLYCGEPRVTYDRLVFSQ